MVWAESDFRFFKWWAISMLSLAAAAILGIFAFFQYLDSTMCSYDIVREFPSPDKRHIALVILGNCGATTPFVSLITVTGPDKKIDLKGDDYFFSNRGENDIEVIWDGNSALIVSYEGYHVGGNYRKRETWRSYSISYHSK